MKRCLVDFLCFLDCDGAVGGDSAGDGMKDVDDLYDMENYDSDEEQGVWEYRAS